MNPDFSIQENVYRLENIRNKIEVLFNAFLSTCNLNSSLKMADIINALITEDTRMKRSAKNDSERLVMCLTCKKEGHKTKNCHRNKKIPEENKFELKKPELKCNYCKERGHKIDKNVMRYVRSKKATTQRIVQIVNYQRRKTT